MTMTKRIQYHEYGGPEVVRFEDFDLPRPGHREVRVRVHAAAANPMDWLMRSGEMEFITGRRFPRGMGHDFAGVVEAVGDGVTRLGVGDEVLGAASIRKPGAFAELVVAEEKAVVKKPTGLSFMEAAALPIAGVTAYQALNRVRRLQSGQAVFIAGCLGAVGRAAAQIAWAQGASVAGSCRATAVHDAHDLGIDPVVDFDFDPTPLRAQFDIVFDTSGLLPIKAARALVKPGGRIVDIKPNLVKLVRSVFPGPFRIMIASPNVADLEYVARAAGQGLLRLPIARTVPLDEAIAALAELERSRYPKGGKLMITAGPGEVL